MFSILPKSCKTRSRMRLTSIKELSEIDTLVNDLTQPLSKHETKQLIDLFLKHMKLKNFCPEARDNLKLWKSLLKWDSKPFSDFFKQLVKELAKASDHITFMRKYVDLSAITRNWVPKDDNKRTQETQHMLKRDKKTSRQDRGDQNATSHSEANSVADKDTCPNLKQTKQTCNSRGRSHKPPCRLVNDPLANKNPMTLWAESARGKY